MTTTDFQCDWCKRKDGQHGAVLVTDSGVIFCETCLDAKSKGWTFTFNLMGYPAYNTGEKPSEKTSIEFLPLSALAGRR